MFHTQWYHEQRDKITRATYRKKRCHLFYNIDRLGTRARHAAGCGYLCHFFNGSVPTIETTKRHKKTRKKKKKQSNIRTAILRAQPIQSESNHNGQQDNSTRDGTGKVDQPRKILHNSMHGIYASIPTWLSSSPKPDRDQADKRCRTGFTHKKHISTKLWVQNSSTAHNLVCMVLREIVVLCSPSVTALPCVPDVSVNLRS